MFVRIVNGSQSDTSPTDLSSKQFESMHKVRLTKFCVSLNTRNVPSTFYWLPKDGELGLFIGSYEVAKDGTPKIIRILEQIFKTGVLMILLHLKRASV